MVKTLNGLIDENLKFNYVWNDELTSELKILEFNFLCGLSVCFHIILVCFLFSNCEECEM